MARYPISCGKTRLATDMGLLSLAELERHALPFRASVDNRALCCQPPSPGHLRSSATRGLAVGTPRGITMHDVVGVYKSQKPALTFRLETHHGFEILTLQDQEFLTPEGPKSLQGLEPGDVVCLQSGAGVWSVSSQRRDQGESLGWSLGLRKSSLMTGLPHHLWRQSRAYVVGFLRGFFLAHRGSSLASRESLFQGHRSLLQDVQLLLLNEGIITQIQGTRRSHWLILPEHNRQRFHSLFGNVLPPGRENDSLDGLMESLLRESFQTTVTSIEAVGVLENFGVVIPLAYSVILNGFVMIKPSTDQHHAQT